MAAISHVFTIRRAAQILGRDEDLLWELSDQLEPEDGKLWVYAIDGAETPAFMASRLFAKLSRIRSIAPVNLKTSVPRCSAYAYGIPEFRSADLVLLCHKFRYLFRAAQHGQRDSIVARAATNLRRIVAIEFGTWRSGRNGGSSGLVTLA